jgi:hypothetical protein
MLLRSTLGALALGMLTAGPVLAAAQAVTLYDVGNNPLGSITSPLAANMMAFSTVIAVHRWRGCCDCWARDRSQLHRGWQRHLHDGWWRLLYTVPVVVGWTSLPFSP